MRILLAKRRALGDTVFLSSTVESLAAAVPGASIYALLPGAWAPVLERHPSLSGILTYEEGWATLLLRLRSLKLDHFIQLHSSPSRAWLARLSGAAQVSFSVQNGETEKAYGRHPNALEWDGFFLRSLFGPAVRVPGPLPRIFLSEREREEGRAYWKGLGADPARLVFLGLGASRPTKRWPAAHFARFAELLRDRAGLMPAILPGPGEQEERFAGEVLDQMRALGLRSLGPGGKGDFVHGASLCARGLARALSAVRAYVGNDSGPKHVAAAVGIPTLTFFGPEDPGEWHPYPRDVHPVFFRPGLACRREDGGRWCGLATCSEERHRCMADLDPLDAWSETQRVLGLSAPGLT